MKKIIYKLLILTVFCLLFFYYKAYNKRTNSTEVVIEFAQYPMSNLFWKNHSYETQIQLIKSDAVIKNAISEFRLDELYKVDSAKLTKFISENIDIKKHSETNHFSITFYAHSSVQAQQISFAVIHCDRQHERIYNYYHELIDQYKMKMTELEEPVEDFRAIFYRLCKKHKISYHDIQSDQSIETILKANSTDSLSIRDSQELITAKNDYFKSYEKLKDIRHPDFLNPDFLADIAIGGLSFPYRFHEKGCSKEIQSFMQARRDSNQ